MSFAPPAASPPFALPPDAPPRFVEALGYWDMKRGARAMPGRKDIDPVEIPRLLAHLFLLEVLDGSPLDFRYRLIGGELRRRVRANYVGRRLSEIEHQRPGTPFWANHAAIVEERRPRLVRHAYVGPDERVGGARDLLLPLSEDGRRVAMILGIAEFDLRRP